MIKIIPNSVESIILFSIYISAQDGEVSKEEIKELLIEAPLLKKLYFDLYGEYMDLSMMSLIDEVISYLKSKEELAGSLVTEDEEDLFDNLITDPKVQDIALIIGRHIASADGFHSSESNKFKFWSKRWMT